MRLEIIQTVFRKELREMLRDRRSLLVMFGLPLVLYPALAIGISMLIGSRAKELNEQKDRVAVVNAEAAPHLIEILKQGGEKGENAVNVVPVPADPDAALRQGGDKGLDALVTVPSGGEAKALGGESIAVDLRLNHSRTSADFVQRKLDKAMDRYERWIVEQRLAARGLTGNVLDPVKVATSDVSSGGERFGHILAGSLPVLLLMTGMLGALFPALNATTTERELGTLETLLVTPAGRTELLLAKGALVLLCSLLTAGLNLLSMSLVLLRSLTMVKPELAASFTIPPAALALSFLAAVPALVFFSALVLIVGLVARNFREANSFATPAMLIPLVALGIGIAEPKATPGLLVTPVANTTIIIREVLTGRAPLWQFVLAWASSLLYAGLMLSVAARLFNSEQLVNPAWEPLSWSGLRGAGRAARNRPRRLPAIDAALGLFVVCLLLLFYVSPSWVRFGLIPTVLGNELLLILAPTLLAAWLARWAWRETFRWRAAPPLLLIGAAVFAIGLSPWAQFAYALQNAVWPPDPNQQQAEQELFVTSLRAWPVLTILLAGVLAGFCEEMLFRGPIQTALVRRLPAGLALFTGAFLFGAMHMDLHGLPLRTLLGCWLAWLVWRGRSIFPAMLAHFLYDSTSLAIAAYSLHAEAAVAGTQPSSPGLHLSTADYTMLAAGAVLMAAGWLLWRVSLWQRDAAQTTEPRAFEVVPADRSSAAR